MKSTDPARARVVAEIDINNAVAAVEHFADNVPDDHQSVFISERVYDAAIKIRNKAVAFQLKARTEARAATIALENDTQARLDLQTRWEKFRSTFPIIDIGTLLDYKPNSTQVKFFTDDVKSEVMGDVLCRECFVWRGPHDPDRHGVNCSLRKPK